MTNDAPLLSTAPNFRDLGGHPTDSGERVRSGLLYRADGFARIDDADLAVLQRIELRQMLDLRTVVERSGAPDRVPDTAEYVVLDVQGDHSTGGDLASILTDPERADELLADNGAERFMYEVNRVLVAGDDARTAYRELVERAAAGPTPLVFHCSAGKDRTGWGAAVILGLLGVSKEAIIADYLASNDRLDRLRAWMNDVIEKNGIDPALVAPMLEVRPEYLEAAFTEVDRLYGTFDDYISEGLKLTPETIAELRARMLER